MASDDRVASDNRVASDDRPPPDNDAQSDEREPSDSSAFYALDLPGMADTDTPPLDAYVRQRALSGFGSGGQQALANASVALVGVGGLGCPVAQYLAAAGVGQITLIDSDHVSVTNLHRQILFTPDDVGQPKVDAAQRTLQRFAPGVDVQTFNGRITEANAREVLAGHHVIVDGTDTFSTRLIIADAAAELDIPVAWGAVSGWHGQITVFHRTARMRNLFPEEPPGELATCAGGAVLGTMCGQVGTALATEAVKIASGAGTTLAGTLAVIDARTGRWREIPLAPTADSAASQESVTTGTAGGTRA